jgi:NAD+ synthase
MNYQLNITLAQINNIIGDLQGNYNKISEIYSQVENSDIVIFPELALTGYNAEDLFLNKNFQAKSMDYINKLATLTNDKRGMIVGGIITEDEILYNAAFFLYNGVIQNITLKHNLPNYGVFDEKRVFNSGKLPQIINFKNNKIGIIICEDLWSDTVMDHLAKNDAEIIICINASPFEKNKFLRRKILAADHASKHELPLIYLNMVGGQDNIIFDGGSFITNKNKEVVLQLPYFKENIVTIDLTKVLSSKPIIVNDPTVEQQIYQAATLGLRDYVVKNGFKTVILGLSGGVDSALVVAIACDALGSENVFCVMMPSIYTSQQSLEDAEICAKKLGVNLQNINIIDQHNSFRESLSVVFKKQVENITDENLQSRIRGVMLMALSNEYGHLVITTGNKSEMAVGYATLYGDMCGAYNPLKDIYKTEVFKICNWRNENIPDGSLYNILNVIPDCIINKPPTAELRANQTDQDSLPPYEVLDQILFNLIEQNLSIEQIVEVGFERKIVERINKLLYLAEYKRRQAPPGAKVSTMSLSIDRRYPITNKWQNN